MKAFLRRLRSSYQYFRYRNVSYSQEGEDLILHRLLANQPSGFYVDVGAHHPVRFSNTYMFYKRGWRGINIDAMPGSMGPFKFLRPRDINVEAAISLTPQTLDYYVFNEPALNGFSKELSEEREKLNAGYRVDRVIPVRTSTLAEILERMLPPAQAIDFLSVDVEGLDLEVLRSNNWQKFRPRFVLVEVLGTSFEDVLRHEITSYLSAEGYTIYAKAINTCLFGDRSQAI